MAAPSSCIRTEVNQALSAPTVDVSDDGDGATDDACDAMSELVDDSTVFVFGDVDDDS